MQLPMLMQNGFIEHRWLNQIRFITATYYRESCRYFVNEFR